MYLLSGRRHRRSQQRTQLSPTSMKMFGENPLLYRQFRSSLGNRIVNDDPDFYTMLYLRYDPTYSDYDVSQQALGSEALRHGGLLGKIVSSDRKVYSGNLFGFAAVVPSNLLVYCLLFLNLAFKVSLNFLLCVYAPRRLCTLNDVGHVSRERH